MTSRVIAGGARRRILLLVNHWVSVDPPTRAAAAEANARDVLLAAARPARPSAAASQHPRGGLLRRRRPLRRRRELNGVAPLTRATVCRCQPWSVAPSDRSRASHPTVLWWPQRRRSTAGMRAGVRRGRRRCARVRRAERTRRGRRPSGAVRGDASVATARRFRVRVGVEHAFPPGGPGQYPQLLTSCEYASHITCGPQFGAPPGCAGCATREPGVGEVEGSPEQVHRAGLADESSPEHVEHPLHLDQRTPESLHGVGVVARECAWSSANGIASGISTGTGQIVVASPSRRAAPSPTDGTLRPAGLREVSTGGHHRRWTRRARCARKSKSIWNADPDPWGIIEVAEFAGGHVQRGIPPMVHERFIGEADLADDLAVQVQGVARPASRRPGSRAIAAIRAQSSEPPVGLRQAASRTIRSLA